MQDLLNRYPVYFPRRDEQLYTLKQFLDSSTNDKYHLPIIVNITSLNNDGQSIKNILTKNTQLLLINISEFDSILAKYHRSNDGRYYSHRHRLTIKQKQMATKASITFRNMKKLSKSLASLNTVNQTNNPSDDDIDGDDDDDDDDNTYHQRNLVKSLNENRSSSVPLCRLPIQYRSFFELLNENDQSIEPYHKLTDLILIEYDTNDPEKRIEKWPHAFFLRSSCSAYTKKHVPEFLRTTATINDQNSTRSNDSCYGSSSDLDSQKNFIILNDEIQTLQAGQILTILGDCLAVHAHISDKELKEQQPPPPSSTPTSWIKDKSRIFFSKYRRQSNISDTSSNEILQGRSISKKCEPCLKCQTQQGDIVYISLHESGLFSPLNLQIQCLKSNTELTPMDISGVFQLKNLLSNFRLPISVRHLDGSISFDNLYSPASINRHETPTKLRLLMPYNEHVIFVCPLNVMPSKSSKTSSPYIVFPLSVNADIEIQPCINMYDISRTEDFHRLTETCFQLIDRYQNEISLIHFPLQLTNNVNREKQTLHKKRSQSESFVEYFGGNFKHEFQHSDEQLDSDDHSLSAVPSPLRYQDSIETIKQKLSTDTELPANRRSGYYAKIRTDQQKPPSHDEYTSEDEIYQDVDKIYDYIRSGDVTVDVQKIQAKDKIYDSSQIIPTNKKFERQISTIYPSPGTMMVHRFAPISDKPRSPDQDFYSCKNDGNVDDDQAHALYLASKQRTKTHSQNLTNLKPSSKTRKKNKY